MERRSRRWENRGQQCFWLSQKYLMGLKKNIFIVLLTLSLLDIKSVLDLQEIYMVFILLIGIKTWVVFNNLISFLSRLKLTQENNVSGCWIYLLACHTVNQNIKKKALLVLTGQILLTWYCLYNCTKCQNLQKSNFLINKPIAGSELVRYPNSCSRTWVTVQSGLLKNQVVYLAACSVAA